MNDDLPPLPFRYDDGGRAAAGYRGKTGDCAARAIAIAVGINYEAARSLIGDHAKSEKPRGKKTRSTASSGVYAATMHRIMKTLGWLWVPAMGIGTGCEAHLAVGEVPDRCIVRVSKHYVAVVAGTVRDTHNPTRGGSRCVYGWWEPPSDNY